LPFLVKKTFKQINKLTCNTTFIHYLHKMYEIMQNGQQNSTLTKLSIQHTQT
jgi:hypothetical protein